jgi:hypothetical protein
MPQMTGSQLERQSCSHELQHDCCCINCWGMLAFAAL